MRNVIAATVLLGAMAGTAAAQDGGVPRARKGGGTAEPSAPAGKGGGAAASGAPAAKGGAPADSAPTAQAELKTAGGASAGTVTLLDTPNGMLVIGDLRDLPPGAHAIHVHQTGKCDAPKFTSAGDHWAGRGKQHGFKSARGPHAGDLPNIQVGEDGRARFEALAPTLRAAGAAGFLDKDGAAIVVHANPDDHSSQPAGNAGDRIACGVITGSGKR